MKLFFYNAFGLNIKSEVLLLGMQANFTKNDISIRTQTNGDGFSNHSDKPTRFGIFNRRSASIFIKGLASFKVSGGEEIIINFDRHPNHRLIQLCTIGAIFSILLYQRGLTVLHASAIEMEGSVIAFLGKPGSGKSSVAATFYNQGYRVLSDDVTPVDLNEGQHVVYPAFPRLKISREVADLFEYDFDALSYVHPFVKKRFLDIADRFSKSPLPLRSLIIINNSASCQIEKISPQEAMIELIPHTIPTRFLQQSDESHFNQIADLVNQIPIYRLKKPESLSGLLDLPHLITKYI